MSTAEDKKQDELRLRAAAQRQIDHAPPDEPLARPAEELLLELQVHQVELEMQNEALRQAQIALEESRDRYVDLYEFAPVGYLTLGAEGMVEGINLTGATLLGWERKKLLQRSFTSLVIAEDQDRWIRHFLAVKRGDGPGKLELPLQRGDGTVVHAQLDCVRPEGLDPPKVRMTLSDITERMQAQAGLERLEAQLRESQKMEALGTLAGGVAHDFNNALAVILGNVSLARQDVGPGHAALESLSEIDKAGRRVKDLVQQILAFSRRQTLERKPTSLGLAVVETERLLRASLPPSVTLDVDCKSDAPPVLANATQVEQILLNLCGNAMQALKDQDRPGVIKIGLEAHTQDELRGTLRAGRYACLKVQDNGQGMDDATRSRIFEPFFTTKPKNEGTGLGLSVVHGIVQAHDGTVEVESTPGVGSTFRIYLPATDELVENSITSTSETAPNQGHGKHVLYVDDESAIVSLMKRLLERQGYRVSGHTNPQEAVAAVRANPKEYDLVVSDYNMPEMSGLDVADQIHRIRPDLPIVLASGYVTDELLEKAPALGVSKVIYKPNTADDLCAAVTHYANLQRVP